MVDSVERVLLPIWPDAAQALGVGRSTVFELIKSGRLRSVRLGRRRLVPAAAIKEFAEQLEERANATA